MVNFPKNYATTLKIGEYIYCNALVAHRYTWGTLNDFCEDFTTDDIAQKIEDNGGNFEVLFVGVS